MDNVAEAFPADLLPQPCWRCRRTVVYAKRSPTREYGTRPFAIEVVPADVVGHVAIETSLIACGGSTCAYETNLPTRYRWHGPHCDLQKEASFPPSGGAPPPRGKLASLPSSDRRGPRPAVRA